MESIWLSYHFRVIPSLQRLMKGQNNKDDSKGSRWFFYFFKVLTFKAICIHFLWLHNWAYKVYHTLWCQITNIIWFMKIKLTSFRKIQVLFYIWKYFWVRTKVSSKVLLLFNMFLPRNIGSELFAFASSWFPPLYHM